MTNENPFFETWSTPFGTPPFSSIKPEHYRPAFDAGFEAHNRDIAAIAAEAAPASFENTVVALQKSGHLLDKVSDVFFNLTSADTGPELQAIEREIAPVLSRHYSAISLNAALFERIDVVHRDREKLGLDAESRRVLDRVHMDFVRSGAMLKGEERTRLAAILERLATLGTQFGQNILADEASFKLVLETPEDCAGLPDFLLASAAQTAEERGHPGKHVITLSRSSIEPFLQFSTRRDLREIAFKAWTKRGENDGPTDNRPLVKEMLALRAERANLLGYASFADYKLDDTMAKNPANVRKLLQDVWKPAVRQAGHERDDLQALAEAEGANFKIAAHDWRHYAEKLRRQRHAFDESEIKPYFQLEKIIEASFFTASQLFGVSFERRNDVPVYHPDVRAYEVKDGQGKHVGLFLADYFNRASKRSGAWMGAYRSQEKLNGDIRPIIVNVMNFAKAEPALLSFDDARTLFHEFGHGLHGLLSNVTYPRLSGTSVARDFVEFPSQLFEHWLEQPEVLRRFALHYRTGEPMPEALLEKVLAARNFNQGFTTVEYLASAIVDLDFHELKKAENVDVSAFEAESLAKIGMPAEIVMRHRTPHFSHVFSGDGYSSGYYSYLWSEVLDADGFDAFTETGNVFDPATAKRLKDFVYSAGGRQDSAEAYTAFRGRMPSIEPLLEKRGLTA